MLLQELHGLLVVATAVVEDAQVEALAWGALGAGLVFKLTRRACLEHRGLNSDQCDIYIYIYIHIFVLLRFCLRCMIKLSMNAKAAGGLVEISAGEGGGRGLKPNTFIPTAAAGPHHMYVR